MSSQATHDTPTGAKLTISLIVVTHNSSSSVAELLRQAIGQLGADDELIVVDNGSSDTTVDAVRQVAPAARVIEQGNAGFAGGCNAGADVANGDLLLFLNPDLVLCDGALAALRDGADQPGWQAWQPLVELEDGRRVNTAGGEVHFTGIAWAGRCGEPTDSVGERPRPVAFASGAALAVRAPTWRALGGMPQRFFLYAEDLEFGLRVWLGGGRVGLVPAARVRHDYEFAKGDYKWRMLERNRLATVFTVWPAGLLVALLPALLITELALVFVAARGRWLGALLRAWADVLRWVPWIARRRRAVQSGRAISSAEFATLLTHGLDSPFIALPSVVRGFVTAGLRGYWVVCRLLIGRRRSELLDNPAVDSRP